MFAWRNRTSRVDLLGGFRLARHHARGVLPVAPGAPGRRRALLPFTFRQARTPLPWFRPGGGVPPRSPSALSTRECRWRPGRLSAARLPGRRRDRVALDHRSAPRPNAHAVPSGPGSRRSLAVTGSIHFYCLGFMLGRYLTTRWPSAPPPRPPPVAPSTLRWRLRREGPPAARPLSHGGSAVGQAARSLAAVATPTRLRASGRKPGLDMTRLTGYRLSRRRGSSRSRRDAAALALTPRGLACRPARLSAIKVGGHRRNVHGRTPTSKGHSGGPWWTSLFIPGWALCVSIGIRVQLFELTCGGYGLTDHPRATLHGAAARLTASVSAFPSSSRKAWSDSRADGELGVRVHGRRDAEAARSAGFVYAGQLPDGVLPANESCPATGA
jgi:hypothetical protein